LITGLEIAILGFRDLRGSELMGDSSGLLGLFFYARRPLAHRAMPKKIEVWTSIKDKNLQWK
jgi:hypothetical protein